MSFKTEVTRMATDKNGVAYMIAEAIDHNGPDDLTRMETRILFAKALATVLLLTEHNDEAHELIELAFLSGNDAEMVKRAIREQG